MVCRDVAKRRREARLEDADAQFVRRHIREAQDAFVADDVRGTAISFQAPSTHASTACCSHALAVGGDILLEHEAVQGNRFRRGEGDGLNRRG